MTLKSWYMHLVYGALATPGRAYAEISGLRLMGFRGGFRARLPGYGLTLLPSPTFQLYGILCKSIEGHDALASFAFLSFHLQDVRIQTSAVGSALSMLVSTSS